MTVVSVFASCSQRPLSELHQQAPGHTTPPKAARQDPVADRLRDASRELARGLSQGLPANATVAVLPFVDVTGGVRRAGVLLAEGIETELAAQHIPLVDRRHLDSVLAEIDLQSVFNSSHEASTKLTHADALVMGRTSLIDGDLRIATRVIDVKTGRIFAASSEFSLPATGLEDLLWFVRRPSAGQAGDLPPLSIRFDIASEIAGGERVIGPGVIVDSGERFKIRVRANSDCFLYILLYDSQQHVSVLHPRPETGTSEILRGGVTYEIPSESKWYWFDENPGPETFYLLATYVRLDTLEHLLAQLNSAVDPDGKIAQEIKSQVLSAGEDTHSEQIDHASLDGLRIKTRGVGGILDVGQSDARHDEKGRLANILMGHAAAMRELTVNHR